MLNLDSLHRSLEEAGVTAIKTDQLTGFFQFVAPQGLLEFVPLQRAYIAALVDGGESFRVNSECV